MQKLLEKELIIISGRNEKAPGQPLLYSTSKNFMDYFGINSAEDLPKIKEVIAEQLVEPTVIKDVQAENESSADEQLDNTEALAVNDGGELVINDASSEGEEN